MGTLHLEGLRISVVPKIGFGSALHMVCYAQNLTPTILPQHIQYESADLGLADLMAEALLAEVEQLARRGLSSFYQQKAEELTAPRGRICMKSAASRAGRLALTCLYDDYTSNVKLNQALAEGLKLASRAVTNRGLRIRLLRARERYFSEKSPLQLGRRDIESLLSLLNRRTSHYRASLTWIQMFLESHRLGRHESVGESSQHGFLVDMNLLFERFLERHFQSTAPIGYGVSTQQSFGTLFRYTRNPRKWKSPTVRPDFVFHRSGRVIAVGDAKYKDRTGRPPDSAELYQLTMYGLMFRQKGPKKVFLFHPVESERRNSTAQIEFQAPGVPTVSILIVGVPVASILNGDRSGWDTFQLVFPETSSDNSCERTR